jgi:hypothetical protein
MAAGIAGRIYRRLNGGNYFAQRGAEVHASAMVADSRQ